MKDDVSFYKNLIREKLDQYLLESDITDERLVEAIRYTLFSGGKFLRPLLTLSFCNLCKGDINMALPLACAVEMVHTYSLIHDDLPCMDNDSTRRGKPSNHVVNGETFAVLAGDALFSLAAEIVTGDETAKLLGAEISVKAANILFKCCGVSGMVDGQAMDISLRRGLSNLKSLNDYLDFTDILYLKKTGKLFGAACALGCLAAGSSEKKVRVAQKCGEKLGVAYQVIDDLKDNAYSENADFVDSIEDSFIVVAGESIFSAMNTAENNFCLDESSFVNTFGESLKLALESK